MKKILSFSLVIFIFCNCLLSLGGCTDNNAVSSQSYVQSEYEFTEEGKIILYQDTPYYGFVDEDNQLCDRYATDKDGNDKLYACIKKYETAEENSDFVVQDYFDGVSIVRYKGKSSTVEIPETLNGKSVIKIGGYLHNYGSDDEPLHIYRSAFDCSQIKKIVLPKSVREIVYNSFHTVCYSEKDPSDDILETIEVSPENQYYSSDNGMLYNKDKSVLFCVPSNNKLSELNIDLNTASAYEIISSNTVKLNIPSDLKEISAKEYDPISDEKVISKTITELFDCVENTVLNEIAVSDKNNHFSSKDGILYNKNGTELIIYPFNKHNSEFIVPKSVKKVDGFCINKINNLKALVFGKETEEINCYVFYSPDAEWSVEKPYLDTVKGYKNTAAETWANDNKVKFEALDD